jgi:hypothetical protein
MNPDDEHSAEILGASHTVAVVGLSEKHWWPSHQIAAYLQGVRLRVIPVNPHIGEALGEWTCPSLAAVAHPVNIVDVFRRAETIPALAEEMLRLPRPPPVFWMQMDIALTEAGERLRRSGIEVIEYLCIKPAHALRIAACGSE